MFGLPTFRLPKGAMGCIEQWISLITTTKDARRAGGFKYHMSSKIKIEDIVNYESIFWHGVTDSPTCANEVVAYWARWINDNLTDGKRQRLWGLIERLAQAQKTSKDSIINKRLTLWVKNKVHRLYIDSESFADGYAYLTDTQFQLQLSQADLVLFLDDLLDQHLKECAEEGVLHEIDDAICFIGSQEGGS